MPDMTLQQALDLAARQQQAGELAAAESTYRQILAHHPGHAPSLHLLGVVRAQVGAFDDAVSFISRAIDADPSNADYHANLGTALYESGKADRAIPAYRRALTLAPRKPEIHNNLANALMRTRALNEAIAAFHEALLLRPDYFEAQLHLGIAYAEAGDWASACQAYQRSLALRPNSSEAHQNLGQALHQLARFDEAIGHLKTAQRLSPNSHSIALDLGNALRESGKIGEAQAAYRYAIALKPDFADAHYGLSWALLSRGEFSEGFVEYEWRHRLAEAAGATPVADVPWWDGSSLKGKRLLLQAEQGFGDTIFALRYLPRMAAWGARVVVRAPSPLVRLLRRQPGIDRVIENDKPATDVQLQSMMMSLPMHFVICFDEISLGAPPYLFPDTALVETWQKRQEQGEPHKRKKVGLVWAGRPTPPGRSIPFAVLSKLLEIPGIEFHSLQKGGQAADARGSAVKDWDPHLTDFADTAALIASLDLVITIDTAVAHLAGAMGKPVWVMLQYAADWRWFRDRSDSPWYPTMRLFRQSTPGDWPGVVQAVSQALNAQFSL